MPGQHGAYTELSSTSPDSGVPGLAVIPGVARRQGGFVFIPGLVQNLTGQWLRMIMEVHLLDAAGRELAAHSTLGEATQHVAPLSVLPPCSANGFMYLRGEDEIDGQVVRCQLVVTRVAEAQAQPAFAVSDVQVERDDLGLSVTGIVTNKGPHECRAAMATVVGYAADGRAFYVQSAGVEDSTGALIELLLPGQAGRFTAMLDDETGAIVRLEVIAGSGLY